MEVEPTLEAKYPLAALALVAALGVRAQETPVLFERGGKIYRTDDLKGAVCLTADWEGEQRSPAWDPPHDRWAFLAIRPGQSRIWIRRWDEGNLLVGDCPDTARELTWGGGGMLYYTYTQYGRTGALQVIHKRGAFSGIDQDLLSGAIESHPSWSGGRLIWSRGRQGTPWQIWSATDLGDDARPLLEGSCAEPVWSPDGTRIAYASNRSGTWEIYVTEATSRSTNRLTKSPKDGWARKPAWSPGGDRLVFECNWRPETLTVTEKSNLAVIPSNGGKPVLLVEDGHNPAW